MNAVFRKGWAGRMVAACRMCFMGLAMAMGAVSALPGHAQEARSHGAESLSAGGLPDSIPVKRDSPAEVAGHAGDYWWIAVFVVGGLLVLAVVIARRRVLQGQRALGWRSRLGGLLNAVPAREIRRVSSMPLSPRHSLHVVEWNNRRLLLGCTEQSILLLAETVSPTKPEESTSIMTEVPR